MAIDFHAKSFDESTKVKLSLYEDYLKEWLPVFLGGSSYCETVNIFDFFCGPGRDKDGNNGSPLITIEALRPYLENITRNCLNVNLYFNDEKIYKTRNLQERIDELQVDSEPFEYHISSNDFQVVFERLYPTMAKKKTANFLFFDQTGIKHITTQVFKQIIQLKKTDFLFFISSSTINRFCDHPDIKKFISISRKTVNEFSYLDSHRMVLDYYKSLIPQGMEYYLAPFSLKKGPNIYGLIFGSGNIRGLDKFLNRCWKIDPIRGDANFDIDQDSIDLNRPKLFQEMNKSKKLQVFEKDLAEHILSKKLQTNVQIFFFTLTRGHISKHAREVVRRMIKNKSLPSQKMSISYDSCIKKSSKQTIILK